MLVGDLGIGQEQDTGETFQTCSTMQIIQVSFEVIDAVVRFDRDLENIQGRHERCQTSQGLFTAAPHTDQ